MRQKKLLSLLLLIFALCAALPLTAAAVNATPAKTPIRIDGQTVQFDAYNIAGNNYVKLRDLAQALSGSPVQFDVRWNRGFILLSSHSAYTPVGGELTAKGGGVKNAALTTASIAKDGIGIPMTVYNIDKNNYFKLRDIGEIFDFSVEYDKASACVQIDSSKPYVMPAQTGTALTVNSYLPLLVGKTKAEIDAKLGASTPHSYGYLVSYAGGAVLGFDYMGEPLDTSVCRYVSGPMHSFISGSYSSLNIAQIRKLFTRAELSYSEGDSSYNILIPWGGGTSIFLRCSDKGVITRDSFFSLNAYNLDPSPAVMGDFYAAAARRWHYTTATGSPVNDPTGERWGDDMIVEITHASASELTFNLDYAKFGGPSWVTDTFYGCTLYSTDGVHYSATGLVDSWMNVVSVKATLSESTLVLTFDTTKADNNARISLGDTFTLR
ncbi:MAG: hypothetical protein RRZ93_02425 [Ruthenibacterium sp.]